MKQLKNFILTGLIALSPIALAKESPEEQLFKAIKSGNKHKVIVLIKDRVNVNARDHSEQGELPHDGDTALMHAVCNKKYAIAEFLIEAGANVNAVQTFFWDKVGGRKAGTNTVLSYASFSHPCRDVNMVKLLAKNPNINLDVLDSTDSTVLHSLALEMSSKRDRVPTDIEPIMRVLVENGANTNLKNDRDQTVLDYVKNVPSKKGFYDFLVSKGAKHSKDL